MARRPESRPSGVTNFEARVRPVCSPFDGRIRGIPALLPMAKRRYGSPTLDNLSGDRLRRVFTLTALLDPIRRATPGLRSGYMEHIHHRRLHGLINVKSQAPKIGARRSTTHFHRSSTATIFWCWRHQAANYYCLPSPSREARHRLALCAEHATSGDMRGILYWAPTQQRHAIAMNAKRKTPCGAAGPLIPRPTPCSISRRIGVRNSGGTQLDKLEGFASRNGPDFYRLPVNDATITLEKTADPVAYPAKIETGAGPVTVFDPGFPLHWRVV